jgi:hypothetical protein
MDALELLYYVLAFAVFIITVGFVVIVVILWRLFETVRLAATSVYRATRFVNKIQSTMKLGVLSFLDEILGKIKLGGEKHGKAQK